MREQNYIGKAVEELYRIFDALNERYYQKGLPAPIITIQANRSSRSQSYGWFTLTKVWINQNNEEEKYHEINICPEYLCRNTTEIAATLAHEMVHFYNQLREVKDSSDKVHNKKFKNEAEQRGLLCHKDPKVGWVTTPTTEFVTYVSEEVRPNNDSFAYFRQIPPAIASDKETKKTVFKYKCPECELEVKGKKDIDVMCGKCEVHLEIEEED